MTTCVVDTNFLRDKRIVEFLRASDHNTVAISEYTCVECYQGDALKNIERSMHYVDQFPNQVLILRCAIDLVAAQDASGLRLTRSDLVEPVQTSNFSNFCQGVRAASLGDQDACRQLRDHGHAAAERLNGFLDDATLVAAGIKGLAASTDRTRLARIRKGQPFSRADSDWFFALVFEMARLMFQGHPKVTRLPGGSEMPRYLVFRYALSGCLLMRRWIQDGGIESAPTKKLANDVIDLTIATYGTYFDGILSLDRKLLDIHDEARWLLANVFADPVGEPA